MSRYMFLFDLDSTVTKQEILPTIAKKVGKYDEMRELTEKTMRGEMPFKQSFLRRVDILSETSVSEVQDIVADIELNEKLVEFIRTYQNRCYIVTGNLDVWVEKLMRRIGMDKNVFCSKALVSSDRIEEVFSIVDKNAVIKQMVLPFVAVGDGNNDAEMIEAAEVGIGFGGVRRIAPSVLECATHAVYQESRLVDLLNKLI